MPASSLPICSRGPASTVWRLEVNGSQFNWLRVLRTQELAQVSAGTLIPAKQLKQLATSAGKTLRLYRQSPTKPNRSGRNAEAVFPPFHHSARRHLHPGLAVQPERNASRSTRFRAKLRAPAGVRLQQQESIGGLRDLLRQRDQRPLTQFFCFLPSTSNDPDGMPPSGSLCFCCRCGEVSRIRDAAYVTLRPAIPKDHQSSMDPDRCSISFSHCSPAWSPSRRPVRCQCCRSCLAHRSDRPARYGRR